MRLSKLVGFILAIGLDPATAAVAECKLPPDVSTRVGRASTFIYNWTPAEYANEVASRDYHWNNQPTTGQGRELRLSPESFSSAYTAVNRVPERARTYGSARVISACANEPDPGGCTLEWFQRNHPNWIVYRHDQATPAWEFGDRWWIPLDISNPEVRVWIENNQLAPILAAGYQGISLDNISDRNDWDEEGVCSAAIPSGTCTDNRGKWTQLYSGRVSGDAAFISARVDWLKEATRFIHEHNGCSSGNVTYDAADRRGTISLIDAVDIWYDEDGFTGDSNPSACSPAGGGSGSVGAAWIAKAQFVLDVAKPMVQENSICPRSAPPGRLKQVLNYALASYLLTKDAHTYLAWYFDDGTSGDVSYFNDPSPWPELSWMHGTAREPMTVVDGVYRRIFADGLVLLNPSTDRHAEYNLSSIYVDFDGASYSGRIILPPSSALVLHHPVSALPSARH